MKLSLLPTLAALRDLLRLPCGPERFSAYLALMLEGDRVKLPLQSFNPMSREHVADLLDHLLALAAEEVAAEALRECERRLFRVSLDLRFCLVVVDDLRGGWTNRHFADLGHRQGGRYDVQHGFAVGYLWSSERAQAAEVRAEALAVVYRAAHRQRFGEAKTVDECLRQEGRALRFAGADRPALPADDLEYSRQVIAPHLASSHPPVVLTCLYGDEAARSVGYPPLGLSANAGLALALSDGRGEGTPEAVLEY